MSADTITHLIIEYRYWILVPLAFVEGPIVAFVAGTLAFLGYFNPYIAFAIFFIRDMLLDGFFYYLGKWGGKTKLAERIMKKIGVTGEHLDDVHALWKEHGFRTMFFTKLSYGISAAFILVAGIVEMDYTAFFRYAALVAIIQYGTLFMLGYYFGNAFGTVSSVLNNMQYVLGGIVLIATAYFIFTKFMRKKLIEQETHRK